MASRYGADARIGALVHCAGILRDKMLANMDEARWASVLQVNLAAQLRKVFSWAEPAGVLQARYARRVPSWLTARERWDDVIGGRPTNG